MKITSHIFLSAKPGSPGRRQTRHLNNRCVARAVMRSMDPDHQDKFLSSTQRMGRVLRRVLKQRPNPFAPQSPEIVKPL